MFCLTFPIAANSYSTHEDITFFLLRGIGRESGHWGSTFTQEVRQELPCANFVLMDLPGAGKYYNKPALSTIEKMADFLRREYLPILDSVPGKRIIVATSLAGNVALEWVTQYPTDFHGAVLMSTSLKGVCKGKERVKPEAKTQFVSIFLTNDLREREEEFLSINSNGGVKADSLLDAWEAIQKMRPVSKGALLKQTVAGMTYKPTKDKRTLPILVIGSKSDKIVSVSCFEKVANTLDAELILHTSAGHGIPIDAPLWLASKTSFWAVENVLSSSGSDEHEKIPTRQKDNGMFPVKWLDQGISSAGVFSDKAANKAGKVFSNSWSAVDDGFDWVGKFMKEVKVEDKDQKKQLKKISRDLGNG